MPHEQTVLAMLARTAARHPDAPALRSKRDGVWHTDTWRDYETAVRLAGRAYLALGVEPKKGVVVLGYNRPEWFLAHLGAIAAGAVPAGIYTTSTAEQCRYIARHAEAQIAVVENREALPKLLASADELPELRHVVLMHGEEQAEDAAPRGAGFVLSWKDFLARGAAVTPAALTERLEAQGPDDRATLIYTSGTTGEPKAVMLSHRNLTWTAQELTAHTGVGPGDVILSYLPLSHIAEQVVSLHGPIATGSCTAFAESLEKLAENLREIRPTFFFGVPRVWEKMQAGIQAAGAQAPPLRRRIAAWARRQGLAAGYAGQNGGPRPLFYGLADRLVFSKVRARLGFDRLRYSSVSAAPVARDTLEFFFSLGIPVVEVYGMSECTGPATLSAPEPGRYRIGSAGPAFPGSEVKIAEDGEILMRGPHVFLGYFKNPEATAETLDADGWLHSGDIGALDERGFLTVTDRKKELIVTSGGKNIGPAGLEAQLKQIPMVAQAVVIGDRRPYLSALFVLDAAWLARHAEALGSAARDLPSSAVCPVLRAKLEAELEAMNARWARYEQVRRFAILPAELTVASGELTPTMKLKRRVILANHAATIDSVYSATSG
jgi:long-subunit acyl-CoA synthetase (AMP-forming)